MNIPAKYRIATAKQSRQVDAQTSADFGIDGFTLMEMAGTAAAKILLDKYAPESRGVFLCGKGNNGGDALVAARYLAQHGITATIVFIAGTDDLSASAEKNHKLLQTIAQNDENTAIDIISSWDDFEATSEPDFIIDGMLGTGLNSDLRGALIDAVEWVNGQSCSVFSMDIPTGIHADTGHIMGNAVESAHTFAFGLLKQGYYLNEGKKHAGSIHFCELPFPNYISKQCSTYLMNSALLESTRDHLARHKYEAGVVHIIAGSEGLTGAAIMAAKSAWAVGVGAVILICPRGVLSVFENNLPQIIKKPVGKQDDFFFKHEHLNEVQEIVAQKDSSVLIGPGIGRNKSTITFVNDFLAKSNRPMTIDADALWTLAQQETWSANNSSWILTPHPGELSTLTCTHFEDDFERFEIVHKFAHQNNVTLLSKGFPVVLGTSTGTTYLTAYDTRIFSRAGCGDILAGKIAAYRSLEHSPHESCIRALLDGKAKADLFNKNSKKSLEPLHLV